MIHVQFTLDTQEQARELSRVLSQALTEAEVRYNKRERVSSLDLARRDAVTTARREVDAAIGTCIRGVGK